jgi:hypothetical protein
VVGSNSWSLPAGISNLSVAGSIAGIVTSLISSAGQTLNYELQVSGMM